MKTWKLTKVQKTLVELVLANQRRELTSILGDIRAELGAPDGETLSFDLGAMAFTAEGPDKGAEKAAPQAP